MAVLTIARNFNPAPQVVNMSVDNTLAQVIVTGYLVDPVTVSSIEEVNSGAWEWLPDDMVLISASDGDGWFTVSSDLESLVLYSTAGNGAVTLPVVANDFVVFDGTLGALKDLGFSASDPSKSKVVMAGSAVQVGYIAHFVDTAGTIDDTAGTVQNDGPIQSGKSGTQGALIAYAPTAASGFMELLPINAGGNFNSIISNSAIGQTSTYTLPDPANAAARFLVGATATPFVSGNFPVASGTGGLMVDSGVAAASLQSAANIKAATTGNIGGAGAGPISVAVAGATAASVVVATVEASSNPVSVIAATATGTGFDVTFSADPGAACTLNYILFIAAQ